MRLSLLVLMALLLTSCARGPKGRLVQEKHAENEALAERVNDPDPTKRPTLQQMQVWAIMNSKDWESLDRLENHWKPNQRFIVPMQGAVHGK